MSPLEEQHRISKRRDIYGNKPDCLGASRAVRLCKEYNQFLAFAGYDDSYVGDRTTPQSAEAIVRAGRAFESHVQELEEILDEAKAKVLKKCEKLEQSLDDFIITSANAPGSYRHGDLLC